MYLFFRILPVTNAIIKQNQNANSNRCRHNFKIAGLETRRLLLKLNFS